MSIFFIRFFKFFLFVIYYGNIIYIWLISVTFNKKRVFVRRVTIIVLLTFCLKKIKAAHRYAFKILLLKDFNKLCAAIVLCADKRRILLFKIFDFKPSCLLKSNILKACMREAHDQARIYCMVMAILFFAQACKREALDCLLCVAKLRILLYPSSGNHRIIAC